MVCPALWPPWYRTTIDISLARMSVSLPFPSSPHWVPTTTVPGTLVPLDGRLDGFKDSPPGRPRIPADHASPPTCTPQEPCASGSGLDHKSLQFVAQVCECRRR